MTTSSILHMIAFLSLHILPGYQGNADSERNTILKYMLQIREDILNDPHISEAYFYEYHLKEGKTEMFVESFGIYSSIPPPKDNIMLHKYFSPELMRKGNQSETIKQFYDQICRDEDIPQKTAIPMGYSSVLGSYRWLLEMGPFSQYYTNYVFKVIREINDTIEIHFELNKPMGYRKKYSGIIYLKSDTKELTKVVLQDSYFVSILQPKRMISQNQYYFTHNSKKGFCTFSKILINYSELGYNVRTGIILLNTPRVFDYTKEQISFLESQNNRPFVIYDEASWEGEMSRLQKISMESVLLQKDFAINVEDFDKNSNQYFFDYTERVTDEENIYDKMTTFFNDLKMKYFKKNETL